MRKEEARLLAIGRTVKQYLHAKKVIDQEKLAIACKYAFGGVPLEFEPNKILKLYNEIQTTAAQEAKTIMKEKVTSEYDGEKWKDPWDNRKEDDVVMTMMTMPTIQVALVQTSRMMGSNMEQRTRVVMERRSRARAVQAKKTRARLEQVRMERGSESIVISLQDLLGLT